MYLSLVLVSRCGFSDHLPVVVIYYHLSKLSVDQVPRLCNLPSKSYSNNIDDPYPGGNDLVKESFLFGIKPMEQFTSRASVPNEYSQYIEQY